MFLKHEVFNRQKCYLKLNFFINRETTRIEIEIIPNKTKNELELNNPIEILFTHNFINEKFKELNSFFNNKYINCKKE